MHVEKIESTPNPNALKFTVDVRMVPRGSRSFTSADAAAEDSLAKQLFEHPGVMSVFYMDRFVTVSKETETPWNELVPEIQRTLETTDYEPPVDTAPEETSAEAPSPTAAAPARGEVDDEDKLKQINELLDETVRPALAGDGGGIEVVGLQGSTLVIHYQGACGSCPSSISGTLQAIENLLRHGVDPEIQVVAAETAAQ